MIVRTGPVGTDGAGAAEVAATIAMARRRSIAGEKAGNTAELPSDHSSVTVVIVGVKKVFCVEIGRGTKGGGESVEARGGYRAGHGR